MAARAEGLLGTVRAAAVAGELADEAERVHDDGRAAEAEPGLCVEPAVLPAVDERDHGAHRGAGEERPPRGQEGERLHVQAEVRVGEGAEA